MNGWMHDDRTGRFETQIDSMHVRYNVHSEKEFLHMTGSDIFAKIFSNGAVWGALLLLLNLIVSTYFPNVSADIVAAANVLAIAILGAVGVYGVGAQAGYIKAQTERDQ